MGTQRQLFDLVPLLPANLLITLNFECDFLWHIRRHIWAVSLRRPLLCLIRWLHSLRLSNESELMKSIYRSSETKPTRNTKYMPIEGVASVVELGTIISIRDLRQ